MYQQGHVDCKSFCAGQINVCKDQWTKFTSDHDILQMVNGYKLELIESPEQIGLPS